MPRKKKRDDFLGAGWKYPFYTGDKNPISRREEAIAESMRIILSTAKGERVMRPEFGCDLNNMVFAINDSNTHNEIASHVEDALSRWEPRIIVESVGVRADEEEGNKILIDVDYQVIDTNTRRNLVYPFYL